MPCRARKLLLGLVGYALIAGPVGAQATPAWIIEGPRVESSSFSLELPLEVLANKLFVEVEIGGEAKRFVFDTGSPSMIGKRLATELGLQSLGKIKGKDSHGAVVESEIVEADLSLGGTIFRDVPILAADFSSSKIASCLFDGVLGSEVLPLCAWQIDLPDSVLRCSTDLSDLNHLEGAAKLALHDFGYPHTPYLDIRFAKNARSKAMFDTGSPDYLTISPPDFDGAKRNGGVASTIAGRCSLGSSLGGQAPVGDHLRAELKAVSLGGLKLGRLAATVRESPPSLIGAWLLEHYVVTLDPRSKAVYFDSYRGGPFRRQSFGFSMSFEEEVAVSMVWDGTPADKAGLRIGQRITSLNGVPTRTSCEGIQQALTMISGKSIDIEWDGGRAALR